MSDITIIHLTDEYKNAFEEFYNRIAPHYGYLILSKDEFQAFFYENEEWKDDSVRLALINNKIVGASIFTIRKIDETNFASPSYLTLLIVDPAFCFEGIGSALLNEVETCAKISHHKTLRISYQSTLNLPWEIRSIHSPNKELSLDKPIIHPGAPGAMINESLYLFLFRHGYEVVDEQDSFYIDLVTYQMPQTVIKQKESLSKKGFDIELYDIKKHYGLIEFFSSIHDEAFIRVIKENLAKTNPNPFYVVSKEGRILGWTGAFYTEPTGRAHFDGICISPEVRGYGIGTILFHMLLDYSKHNGATYITFFTGRNNFARKIYFKAGGKITKSFAIMEKEM